MKAVSFKTKKLDNIKNKNLKQPPLHPLERIAERLKLEIYNYSCQPKTLYIYLEHWFE